MNLRIGIGNDVHALVPGRPCILGGVTIPHHLGLLGHSDADALIHAVIDAILGAVGEGDIGTWFPDNDPVLQGVNSMVLLKKVAEWLEMNDWQVINIDTTIIAEKPKMSPYKQQMAKNIALCLGIESNRVNVKAKTNEQLGFLGRQEGIATMAVALVMNQKD